MLLHVVDASNEDLDIQIKTTHKILKDIDGLGKPMITVFNKMDKVDIESLVFDNKDVGEKIFVSGKDNLNLDLLLEMIEENLPQVYKDVTLMIPYDSQTLVNYFLDNYEVDHIEYLNLH